MKYLVTHEIINSIAMNVEAGNITPTDGRKLKSLTLQLYHHIYDKYQEVADEGVSEAVEEAAEILHISMERMEEIMKS